MTLEELTEKGYEIVEDEPKEGDYVVVGRSPFLVSTRQQCLMLSAPQVISSISPVYLANILGCPVYRKREPRRWEGEATVRESGGFQIDYPGIFIDVPARTKVRITVEEIL